LNGVRVSLLSSYVFDFYVLFSIDSGEATADGDKASTENSKKRKLKTPMQVMALENFYNGKLWLCCLHMFLYTKLYMLYRCDLVFLQSISIRLKK
jgi:hypothetical protein